MTNANDHARKQLDVMRAFLESPVGGAWKSSEVTLLFSDRREEIQKAINEAEHSEYAFVFVVGQGARVSSTLPWKEIILSLAGGTVSERDLNPGTDRCAIVFDLTQSRGAFQQRPLIFDSVGAEADRELFDRSVVAAEKGVVTMYAAQSNSITDVSLVELLVTEATAWAKTTTGVLDFATLANRLSEKPQRDRELFYLGGRRSHHLPFAVSGPK